MNLREVQWRCPGCLNPHREKVPPPATGPWSCAQCRKEQPAHAEAIDAGGRLVACPVCGCPDLYRQRDFNRKIGITIILVGAVLAPWTHFLSLVVCALIDFAIYRFVPEAVVCYHCQAILRQYGGAERIPLYDLNTSDKYLQIERERGW